MRERLDVLAHVLSRYGSHFSIVVNQMSAMFMYMYLYVRAYVGSSCSLGWPFEAHLCLFRLDCWSLYVFCCCAPCCPSLHLQYERFGWCFGSCFRRSWYFISCRGIFYDCEMAWVRFLSLDIYLCINRNQCRVPPVYVWWMMQYVGEMFVWNENEFLLEIMNISCILWY